MRDDEHLSELRALTASVRAWLEQHESAGSVGLPRGPRAGTPRPAAVSQASPSPVEARTHGAPKTAAPPAFASTAGVPPGGPQTLGAQTVGPQTFGPQTVRPQTPLAPTAAAPRASAPTPDAVAVAALAGPPAAAPPTPTRPAAAPSAPPLGGGDRVVRLAALSERVRGCVACGLCDRRTQTVFARGNPAAELCFVGEGPGADEDRLGEPFVGAAGQLLDRMIAAMKLGRDEVYVCNVVKCRPPDNRKPTPEEMATCTPFLAEQLEVVAPKVIVALGATAVQGLLGTSEGITRLRGKWKLYKGTIPVMPTYHPAYLLRTPDAKRDVWSDLQQVMRHLGREPTPRA